MGRPAAPFPSLLPSDWEKEGRFSHLAKAFIFPLPGAASERVGKWACDAEEAESFVSPAGWLGDPHRGYERRESKGKGLVWLRVSPSPAATAGLRPRFPALRSNSNSPRGFRQRTSACALGIWEQRLHPRAADWGKDNDE